MKNVGLMMMVLAGVLSTPVMACDLCSVYSVAQARGESGSGIFAAVAGQFTHFGTVQQDGVKQPNAAEQRLDSYITQIVAGYNFNDRVGVQVNLPWIDRSYKRPDGLAIDQGSLSGIGDITLLGRLTLVTREEEKTTVRWNLVGGVKLPTGSSKRIFEEVLELTAPPPPPGAIDSGIHGHDLALGTGSFDGIVGTSVYARWSRLFLTANAQYAIRTEGSYDYQYANDLTWSVAPGAILYMGDDFTVSLQANISGESKDEDTFQGALGTDTAIKSVYAGPQVNVTWRSKLSAEMGVDLPLRLQNSGFQAVPDYRLRFALNWRF